MFQRPGIAYEVDFELVHQVIERGPAFARRSILGEVNEVASRGS